MATKWRGLFSIYIYIEKIKDLFYQKPLDRFEYNLVEMFLWRPSSNFVQAILIGQKTWPPGAGLIFHIHLYRKF